MDDRPLENTGAGHTMGGCRSGVDRVRPGSWSARSALSPALCAIVLVLACAVVGATGCGGAPSGALDHADRPGAMVPVDDPEVILREAQGDPPAGEETTPSVSADTTPTASWGPPGADVSRPFEAALSAGMPIPVYVPTAVPLDAEVASRPAEDVLPGGPGADLSVLLKTGSGWMLVMEGMAGDLGDLPGEACGLVGQRPAQLYRVLGGLLVQWSDKGAWYGVYGLGESRAAVVRFAWGMVPSDSPSGSQNVPGD